MMCPTAKPKTRRMKYTRLLLFTDPYLPVVWLGSIVERHWICDVRRFDPIRRPFLVKPGESCSHTCPSQQYKFVSV